jgi:hypothetical protein
MKQPLNLRSDIVNIPNPKQIDLLAALNDLRTGVCKYLILEAGTNSYLQSAGSDNKFIVEIRIGTVSSFKHYIIGRGEYKSALKTVWTMLNTGSGPIRIHDSEVLNFEETFKVFNFYMDNAEISPEIKKRNVTKYFLDKQDK